VVSLFADPQGGKQDPDAEIEAIHHDVGEDSEGDD
jgi:hypothetical protein